jgi:protease-4
MEDVHRQFIEAVADGRSLDIREVQRVADGRIFTGRQAKDAKLVDGLGDLAEAIKVAAELAGIEGEPKVVEPKRRFSLRDWLDSRVLNALPRVDFRTGVSLKYLMAF